MSEPGDHDTRTPVKKLKDLIDADLGDIDLVDARNYIYDLRNAVAGVIRYIKKLQKEIE